jgi:DNA-binding HxlR family transcriptional regulator
MRRLSHDDCGLASALNVIGGKWKASILWDLHLGPRRFSDLRRAMPGISEKVLTQQLREMEADGIVARHDYQETPPKVEYTVTALGLTLNDAVTVMSEWGKTHEAWQAARAPVTA